MKKEIRFAVSDVHLIIKINSEFAKFYENKRYYPFIEDESKAPADCTVEYHFVSPPLIQSILDRCQIIRMQGVAGNYYIYESKYAFLFDIYYYDEIIGKKLLVFDPLAKTADVYLDTTKIDEYYYDDLMVIFNSILCQNGGLIFHCSAAKNLSTGQVFIFSGDSGNGKSTIAGIFNRDKRYKILNDDRIIIKKIRDKYVAYGSPWFSKAQLNTNEMGEIKNVFFIYHGKENKVRRLTAAKARIQFLKNIFYTPNWNNTYLSKALSIVKDLGNDIASCELDFLPDDQVICFIEKLQIS